MHTANVCNFFPASRMPMRNPKKIIMNKNWWKIDNLFLIMMFEQISHVMEIDSNMEHANAYSIHLIFSIKCPISSVSHIIQSYHTMNCFWYALESNARNQITVSYSFSRYICYMITSIFMFKIMLNSGYNFIIDKIPLMNIFRIPYSFEFIFFE